MRSVALTGDRRDDRPAGPEPGADRAAVGAWLAQLWDEPAWLRATLVPVGGGRSNLTYRVDSPAGRVVLRRPPVGEPAATHRPRSLGTRPGPTRLPGCPHRAEIIEAYAAHSGLDLGPLQWYLAFGAFKLAVVMAGILARVRTGMVPASMAAGLADSADPLVALGHHVLAEGLDG